MGTGPNRQGEKVHMGASLGTPSLPQVCPRRKGRWDTRGVACVLQLSGCPR